MRFDEDRDVVSRFSLAEPELLGFGGESRVYALNEEQILRVYQRRAERGYIERLRSFYEDIGRHDLPFEVPAVEEIGSHAGGLWAIERRIHGDRMSNFLKSATGDARVKSLASYVALAEQIQEIPFDASDFGELLLSNPLRRPSWSAYLAARARSSLPRGNADLSEDVPGLASIVTAWERELDMLSEVTKPCLVHGDYFPGNVMVDQGGHTIAIIDFSPMTVAGDPRLDILCALIFLEVDDGCQSGDLDVVRRMLADRYGERTLQLEGVYRTYYSLYFSAVKRSDPKLYWWCAENLKRRR